MNVSTMVRGSFALVALALLNACADTPSSPVAATPLASRAVLAEVLQSVTTDAVAAEGSANVAAYEGGPSRNSDANPGKRRGASGTLTVELDPTESFNQAIGPHYIRIPANAVCDLQTTAYGPGQWDLPCDRQRKPFKLTITWSLVNGRSTLSFSPDLRFAPSDNPARWVVLSMKDSKVNLTSDVLWGWNGQWINEGKQDPELWSYVDPVNERVTRRLKHFSGYQVWGFADSIELL